MAFNANTNIPGGSGTKGVLGKNSKSKALNLGRRLIARKNVGKSLAFTGLFSVAILSLGAAAHVNGFSNGTNIHDAANSQDTSKAGSEDKSDALKGNEVGQPVINSESSNNSNGNSTENHSSTTVTVNGQTESTSGNIDKTYQSDDGNTNVHISVQNNSSTGAGQ